jgi:hypothetical protein
MMPDRHPARGQSHVLDEGHSAVKLRAPIAGHRIDPMRSTIEPSGGKLFQLDVFALGPRGGEQLRLQSLDELLDISSASALISPSSSSAARHASAADEHKRAVSRSM